MTVQEYDSLPTAQRNAMHKLQERSGIEWVTFREGALAPAGIVQDYVAIPNFHGMYVGIEADGYTHS